MQTLREIIAEADGKKTAVGHFNVFDSAVLRAIFEAAQELGFPVIVGTSEGEADFFGRGPAAALVKSWREEFSYPVFLNADHTRSLEKIRESAERGYDAVIFDGSRFPLEENIRQTKEAVEVARKIAAARKRDILIEGELGYIGESSQLLESVPAGAAVSEKDLTKPEEAARFVKETGVDLLAPAVGNIHGMLKNTPNPALNAERIAAIRRAAGVPLVLHGGSGLSDADFKAAVSAGAAVIHINTEIRLIWRRFLERTFRENPNEAAPYKLLAPAVAEIKKAVGNRLKLFNDLVS